LRTRVEEGFGFDRRSVREVYGDGYEEAITRRRRLAWRCRGSEDMA